MMGTIFRFGRLVWVLAICLLWGSSAEAITIETVLVGNPGNPPDTRYLVAGRGGVDYEYSIGKYEVKAAQYTACLNAVARTDRYGLYNPKMWSAGNGCKIARSGSAGSYSYSVAAAYADRPVNYVSWADAARFVNWLHNGQPTGVQNVSTTEGGVYDMSATQAYYGPAGQTPEVDSDDWKALNAVLMEVPREADATWVIPLDNEWYKAAYHKNDGVTDHYWDYPTCSDDQPGRDLADVAGNNANYFGSPYPIQLPYYTTVVGQFQNSAGPYGTYGQGGNVWEWGEATRVDERAILGGSLFFFVDGLNARNTYTLLPTEERSDVGFRVGTVQAHAALPGDADCDGDVDLDDFVLLKQNFGTTTGATWGMGDFDGNGTVDLDDFVLLKQNFDN